MPPGTESTKAWESPLPGRTPRQTGQNGPPGAGRAPYLPDPGRPLPPSPRRGRFGRSGALLALCLAVLMIFGVSGPGEQRGRGVESAFQPVVPASWQTAGLEGPASDEVTVLGPWAGPDLESFRAITLPFTRQSGIKVSYESTADADAVLGARLEASAPPDIAILPGTGPLAGYVRAGRLVPLCRVLDADTLAGQYPAEWLEPACVEGVLYGLPYRAANESIVWYNPGQFQRRRWVVPTSWSEMVNLGDTIARLGLSPWWLGLKGSTVPGEAGTDWIENIILGASGPETFDRWVRHEIAWTDPAVRQAFVRWGQIVGGPARLRGGALGALQGDPQQGVDLLYQDLPAAYLYLEGSAVQPLIARRFPQQLAGRDYDFFPLPPSGSGDAGAVLASADVVTMLRDTPASRALLRYLASAEAQASWVQRGGFIAPGQIVGLQGYPDPVSRRAARQVLEARALRFDASLQMPPEVAEAFRSAVRDYVANPGRLDAILARVEQVAQAAYGRARENHVDGSNAGAQGGAP